MAERLRYQRQGLTLRAPRVDFAAQEADARGYSQIAANLDRLSNFFFSMAEDKAQIEGAEYGALNAPSRKQITEAADQGEAIELSGDTATVFGRAARKASLAAVTDELTYLAKRDITDVMTQAQQSNAAPNVVAEQIDSIVAGYASTLDGADVISARNYRANLGIYGNAEYEAYSKKWLTDEKARRKTNWEASWQLTKDNLPKMFASGISQTLSDGSQVELPAPTVETIAAMKKKLLTDAASYYFTAAEIEALADEFDAEVKLAARDTIANAVIDSDNAYLTYLQIEKGSKGLPENVQAALDVLGGGDRATAIQEARQAWLNSISDKNTIRDLREAENQEAVRVAEKNVNSALFLALTDPAQARTDFNNAVNALAVVAPEKATEYRRKMPTDGSGFAFALETDEGIRFTIDAQITNLDSTLTLGKLDQYLLDRKLSYEDWKTYSTTVRSRMDDRFKSALIETRKRLQLPTGMVTDKTILSTWQWNTLNNVEVQMRQALRNAPNGGRDFDAIAWLDDNFDRLTTSGKADGVAAGKAKLRGLTRARVQTLMNQSSGDEKQYYQDLLELADRLKAEGEAVDGF